jgi:hypothetical protein
MKTGPAISSLGGGGLTSSAGKSSPTRQAAYSTDSGVPRGVSGIGAALAAAGITPSVKESPEEIKDDALGS